MDSCATESCRLADRLATFQSGLRRCGAGSFLALPSFKNNAGRPCYQCGWFPRASNIRGASDLSTWVVLCAAGTQPKKHESDQIERGAFVFAILDCRFCLTQKHRRSAPTVLGSPVPILYRGVPNIIGVEVRSALFAEALGVLFVSRARKIDRYRSGQLRLKNPVWRVKKKTF